MLPGPVVVVGNLEGVAETQVGCAEDLAARNLFLIILEIV